MREVKIFRRICSVFIGAFIALGVQYLLKYYLVEYPYLVPNFMLVLVVRMSLFETSPLGAGLAFLLGVFFDLSSGSLIGPWAGAFTVIFALLALNSQLLFVHSKLNVRLAVFFASLMGNFIYFGIASFIQRLSISAVWQMIVESFVTALLAPLLFFVLERMEGKRRGRNSRYGKSSSFMKTR